MTEKVSEAKRIIAAFVALMLGGSVPIEWSDNTAAMTADGVIKLPGPRVGDEAEIAMLTRLAVHEAGHKQHTQSGFDVRLSQKEMGFFNSLEDARMEGCQVRSYPGATIVLSRGLGETLDSLQARLDTGLVPAGQHSLQLDLVIRGLLALAPHGPLAQRAQRLLESLQAHIEPKQREAMDEALSELPKLTSSLEAEQLSRRLVAKLAAEPPPVPSPSENESLGETVGPDGDDDEPRDTSASEAQADEHSRGDDEGATNDGDGREHESDEAERQSEGDDAPNCVQGEGEPEAGNEESSQGTDALGAGQNEADTGPNEPSPTGVGSDGDAKQDPEFDMDLGRLIRGALVERYGEEPKPGASLPDQAAPEQAIADAERLRVVFESAQPDEPMEELLKCVQLELHEDDRLRGGDASGLGLGGTTTAGAIDMDSRLQGVQARLVTILQRELQDRRRRPNRLTESGGRVVASRFWRLGALGDTRIFATRTMRHGIDAAATVLLDKSGSMKGELQQAAHVALAFSLAMQRLGRVATSVSTFSGSTQVTEILQAFGASPRGCARACARLVADGGTPLGHAMLIEIPRLLAQRRPRNWLVIVTDDGPADAPQVLQAMKLAQENDVEVLGVAIGCDISTFIPRSVSITDVNQLPTALATMFREGIAATVPA